MSDIYSYLRIHRTVRETLARYYENFTPVMMIGDLNIFLHDVLAAAVLSGTNAYLIGTRGDGKTLLAETIYKAIMGEEGHYLRGDRDLTLKDLFRRLNLDGKTHEEIFQRNLKALENFFILVDEINRCIGLIQNQFLNMGDGYIEIDGKPYYLGRPDQDYCLMIATGNPIMNGEDPGVFEEVEALLDRIPLKLNVDDYPIVEDDVMEIRMKRRNKRVIQTCDLREEVLEGNRLLKGLDGDTCHYQGILAAYLTTRFKFIEVGGRRFNKTQIPDWRALLQEGAHSAADRIAYASDLSQRSLHENRLADALLLYYHALKQLEGEANPLTTDIMLDCYLDTLMLNMRYDRRFLPSEFIGEHHNGDVKEYLDEVKKSLRNEINSETLEDCAGIVLAADDSIKSGKPQEVQDFKDCIDERYGTDQIAQTAKRILEQKQKKKLFKDRMDDVDRKLGQRLRVA